MCTARYFKQGRVLAKTAIEAGFMVKASLREQQYEPIGSVALRRCLVQLWPETVWWEWRCEIDVRLEGVTKWQEVDRQS